MINTKLILVDGIPGSGKSTTAHFIARQMEMNGIKVRWYYEQERNHPLMEIEKNEDESNKDYLKRVIFEYQQKWTNFINSIKNDDIIYIVESYFFQDVLFYPLFVNDLDKQTIRNYSQNILKIVSCLNPVLIHLYEKDTDRAVRNNLKRRGADWSEWFIHMYSVSPYCVNRDLKGKSGVIQLFQDFTDFSLELFNEYDLNKMQIENSDHNWDEYRRQILTFLDLEFIKEPFKKSNLAEYCGHYKGHGIILIIHEKEGVLYVDECYPDLELLQLSENEFQMEGYPIAFEFVKEDLEVRYLKFTQALCDYTVGDKLSKYEPINLSEQELEEYCGEYICESSKLERNIHTKNGQLYFGRPEGYDSQLIPNSKSKFMMVILVENELEFKFVNGDWQFTFDVKGDKPSTSLFVKK